MYLIGKKPHTADPWEETGDGGYIATRSEACTSSLLNVTAKAILIGNLLLYIKFHSHQLMQFFIQLCISLLSYINP